MVAGPVRCLQAGLVPYSQALAWQEQLHLQRRLGESGDTLLLLQHPPVITLGASGGQEDLLVSEERLRALHIEIFESNRGGRATYHGPGQMVAYPILKLADLDLHAYLWKLEETVIRLLKIWCITGVRDERYPGIWVGREKIAAVGIAVRDGVTMHGLALNINTQLSYFDLITPCGIRDRSVTSMHSLLKVQIPMEQVEEEFMHCFSVVFMRPIERQRSDLPHFMSENQQPVDEGQLQWKG